MSITVCLQKTRLVYLFWLNFGGRFLDEKSENGDFSNNSEIYSFLVEGCAFGF